MPLTIFGDIHANLPALEAAWAAMDGRRLTDRYCLGDLVGYGVHPNEVVAWRRDHQVPTIMGNYDLGVGHDRDEGGIVGGAGKAPDGGGNGSANLIENVKGLHRRHDREEGRQDIIGDHSAWPCSRRARTGATTSAP